jgi:hypothetical protein
LDEPAGGAVGEGSDDGSLGGALEDTLNGLAGLLGEKDEGAAEDSSAE